MTPGSIGHLRAGCDPLQREPVFRYARREREFRPSPVRAVFELALDPRFVSLAGGNPDTGLLPHEEIAEISSRLLHERGAEILQYGSGAGVGALIEVIGALMASQGARVASSNLLITTGSQMGIDLVTKLLCDPGDIVVAEGPTYVGAMGVFGAYEVELRQIRVDPGADILGTAIEHELIVVPGRACFAGEPPSACLRLAYSNSSPEVLKEGARRLFRLIADLRAACPA